jgi:hypothetical protein
MYELSIFDNDNFLSVTGRSMQKYIVNNDLLQKFITCYTLKQTSAIPFERNHEKRYLIYSLYNDIGASASNDAEMLCPIPNWDYQ